MNRDVFILGGKRTPMGEYVGALKDVSAIDHRGAFGRWNLDADLLASAISMIGRRDFSVARRRAVTDEERAVGVG